MAPADWILLFEKPAFQAGCLTRPRAENFDLAQSVQAFLAPD